MKIQKKEIIINFITVGFSSHREARKRIEENELNSKVVCIEQLLAFMKALPIIFVILIVFGVVDSFTNISGSPDYDMQERLIETIYMIPECFFATSLLQLLAGIALLQHTQGLKKGERASVLWFGLYALDWKPSDYLRTDES